LAVVCTSTETIERNGMIKTSIVIIAMLAFAAVMATAQSVKTSSGKGAKYHAKGTNHLTVCGWLAGTNTTNAVDCKHCLAITAKAKGR